MLLIMSDYKPQDNKEYSLINDDFQIKFEDSQATSVQCIKGVALNVTNLEESVGFYEKVGLTKTSDNTLVCPSYDFFTLSLFQVESIDRAKAFGRVAFSCAEEDVQKVFEALDEKQILNTPVTLPTEGKADVVVTIVLSPDSQELCFVGDVGFRDLSKETNE